MLDEANNSLSCDDPNGCAADAPALDLDEATLESEAGREADRRRYRIIKLLVESADSRITIERLRHDRRFTRAFAHRGDTTLEEDFRQIEKLLGAGRPIRVVREGAGTLRWSRAGESSFAELGYQSVGPDDAATNPHTDAKRRIGDYIVRRLLDGEIEVLYLSTGTTVYQVALALLNSTRTNVAAVLTDNAAIVELFCQRAATDNRLKKMHLEILGGRLLFDPPDIAQQYDLQQFARWKCSRAVISVTGLNAATGQLYSFRQSDTKAHVLHDMDLRQVIIPVLPSKIGQAGGRLIHSPRDDAGSGREYRIVTTALPAETVAQLKHWGYQVDTVDGGQAG